MAISDFTPERREIQYRGKPLFVVEGLSLDTLAVLVRTHMPDFEGVFDILAQQGTEGNFMDQVGPIAIGIASQAPGLAANIIAACQKDEPLTEALVSATRRLPLPLQIEALCQIASLTFEEAGDIKKSMESLLVMMAKMRMAPPKAPVSPTPTQHLPAHIRDLDAT